MFARILEFTPKMEKKQEFINTVKNEVMPILKKQNGFLEILPFFPENKTGKVITISLWMEKKDVERYEKEWFPRVEQIVKPYLNTPVETKLYQLETAVCQHFVETLAA